jgi:5-methyltetrahydrofolate--homocysteine methyltransferase
MITRLSFKDKIVGIGAELPFVVIGERINPTRRKKLSESMANGDFSLVRQEARMQVEAGAHILDINAGVPGTDEAALLRECVNAVMEEAGIPLCIDSANPKALAAALEIYPGKALINSTTAESRMMEIIFPLARQSGAAVIGVLTDESGIPATAEGRLRVAETLLERASVYGIPAEDIIIDPLALPVGTDSMAGRVTLEAIGLIHAKLGVNVSLGASNVSFGLPDRNAINLSYLALAMGRGLTAAIADITVTEIRTTMLACELLMGRDGNSARWIRAFRKRGRAQ